MFLYIVAAELCCFTVPFFRDVLDTPDPQHLPAKLAVLAVGAALFVLLIVGAYFYLTRTMNGQMILARLGRDTTSQALWRVGEEELDTVAQYPGKAAFFNIK